MSDHVTLELVDEERALREALDDSTSTSRGEFLKRAVVAGGTIVAGGVMITGLPQVATAAPSPAQDVEILNFALLLEFLEAEFYARAEEGGALSGEALEFARVVGEHERAHVDFLKTVLGRKARRKPSFDFNGTTDNQRRFLATAVVLEDTGVAAYNGQGPRLTKGALANAGSIVSVEARHAAWVRDIVRASPAPRSFDRSQTKAQIQAAVAATGFIERS